MKYSINLGLEYFIFYPIPFSIHSTVDDLLVLMCSQRSEGIAGGDSNFMTESHWLNLFIFTSNPSVNQSHLSMSLVATCNVFGMFAPTLI